MHRLTRDLADSDALRLEPGAGHYMAFVGPPDDYDLLGAAQFSLLVRLGLRHNHTVLDYGCGSLRAGRFLIQYLDSGGYHGLEPNAWLIEDALDRQLGRDVLEIKHPAFLHHDSFSSAEFEHRFDYVLVHSIISHTGPDLIGRVLSQIASALSNDGIAVVTAVEARWPRSRRGRALGWVYPDVVSYRPSDVRRFAGAAGLQSARLRWRHPRQAWYAMAHRTSRLPRLAARLATGIYPRAPLPGATRGA
jgi:SAM-dependent methyltransferase